MPIQDRTKGRSVRASLASMDVPLFTKLWLKDCAACFCAHHRCLIKHDIGQDFTAIASETTKNHTLIDPSKKWAKRTLSRTHPFAEAEETSASFRERVGHPLFGEGRENLKR